MLRWNLYGQFRTEDICHKANIGTRCKTRENTCEQIAIGFANESLARNPDQITKHNEAKTNQFRNHFKQAQFKTALLLIHVFFHGRWFHGCVALVRYSSAGGRLLANANLVKSHGVQGNCSGEECSGNLFKCQNGGRCVDLVINTECNCYRTGYYGQYCEQSGSSPTATNESSSLATRTPNFQRDSESENNNNNNNNLNNNEEDVNSDSSTARKKKDPRNSSVSFCALGPKWCILILMANFVSTSCVLN